MNYEQFATEMAKQRVTEEKEIKHLYDLLSGRRRAQLRSPSSSLEEAELPYDAGTGTVGPSLLRKPFSRSTAAAAAATAVSSSAASPIQSFYKQETHTHQGSCCCHSIEPMACSHFIGSVLPPMCTRDHRPAPVRQARYDPPSSLRTASSARTDTIKRELRDVQHRMDVRLNDIDALLGRLRCPMMHTLPCSTRVRSTSRPIGASASGVSSSLYSGDARTELRPELNEVVPAEAEMGIGAMSHRSSPLAQTGSNSAASTASPPASNPQEPLPKLQQVDREVQQQLHELDTQRQLEKHAVQHQITQLQLQQDAKCNELQQELQQKVSSMQMEQLQEKMLQDQRIQQLKEEQRMREVEQQKQYLKMQTEQLQELQRIKEFQAQQEQQMAKLKEEQRIREVQAQQEQVMRETQAEQEQQMAKLKAQQEQHQEKMQHELKFQKMQEQQRQQEEQQRLRELQQHRDEAKLLLQQQEEQQRREQQLLQKEMEIQQQQQQQREEQERLRQKEKEIQQREQEEQHNTILEEQRLRELQQQREEAKLLLQQQQEQQRREQQLLQKEMEIQQQQQQQREEQERLRQERLLYEQQQQREEQVLRQKEKELQQREELQKIKLQRMEQEQQLLQKRQEEERLKQKEMEMRQRESSQLTDTSLRASQEEAKQHAPLLSLEAFPPPAAPLACFSQLETLRSKSTRCSSSPLCSHTSHMPEEGHHTTEGVPLQSSSECIIPPPPSSEAALLPPLKPAVEESASGENGKRGTPKSPTAEPMSLPPLVLPRKDSANRSQGVAGDGNDPGTPGTAKSRISALEWSTQGSDDPGATTSTAVGSMPRRRSEGPPAIFGSEVSSNSPDWPLVTQEIQVRGGSTDNRCDMPREEGLANQLPVHRTERDTGRGNSFLDELIIPQPPLVRVPPVDRKEAPALSSAKVQEWNPQHPSSSSTEGDGRLPLSTKTSVRHHGGRPACDGKDPMRVVGLVTTSQQEQGAMISVPLPKSEMEAIQLPREIQRRLRKEPVYVTAPLLPDPVTGERREISESSESTESANSCSSFTALDACSTPMPPREASKVKKGRRYYALRTAEPTEMLKTGGGGGGGDPPLPGGFEAVIPRGYEQEGVIWVPTQPPGDRPVKGRSSLQQRNRKEDGVLLKSNTDDAEREGSGSRGSRTSQKHQPTTEAPHSKGRRHSHKKSHHHDHETEKPAVRHTHSASRERQHSHSTKHPASTPQKEEKDKHKIVEDKKRTPAPGSHRRHSSSGKRHHSNASNGITASSPTTKPSQSNPRAKPNPERKVPKLVDDGGSCW